MSKVNYILFIASLFLNFPSVENYIFSVIMAIYNTGRYLDDSVFSILNQTINISTIQIILVNDGSTDKTKEICLNYTKNYPKNIIYIEIEHGGVSKARNIGFKYAEGKFINFFDSDDKWDKNAFKHALLFFKFYKQVNIIGCRLKFFEASESYHPLDYKFYKTRVVNLSEEYNCIQLMASSSFFRYSSIKNESFKEEVFTGEDTRLINNLLLLNPLLGFVKEAIYYYRRRVDSTSAVQNVVKNPEYYFSIIKMVDEYLIEKSKSLYNKILPFIQFYLGYNILFRIIFPAYKYLDDFQLNKYYSEFQKILNQIEDKYIIEQRILTLKIKFIALSKKYNRDLSSEVIIQNDSFIYNNYILMNIKNTKDILTLRIMGIKDNQIHLEGKDNCILKIDKYYYFCKLGDKIFYPKYYYYSIYDLITMYGNLEKGRMIVFDLTLENKSYQELQFFLSYDGNEIEIFPSLGWYSHMTNIYNSYYNSGNYIVKYNKTRISIYKYNETIKELFEMKYSRELKKAGKNNIINLRNNFFKYEKSFKNMKNETWIINDKQNLAGDNGEYFFRFLKKTNVKNIDFYFAINKDCPDYNRLLPLGNILELGSEFYLNKFLISDKIISSVSESWTYNPYGSERKYLIDLFHFDFIFIQNGIIKDDLSKYLNRITKNFSLFITSSNKEYKDILNYKYHYNINNVILTGLPRYDNLQRLQKKINKEKIILVIPTWRMNIKGTFDLNTHESIYSNIFNETNYFNYYNDLINNEKLLLNMKQSNYSGLFCLHPFFSKQWRDFKQNDIFSVLEVCNFQELIVKASLLITDYSSIFFDFAYLKKPIIYTQFDYDDFRNNHYPKSYYDYIKHGFGPVCFDLNCTINQIIVKLKTNCLPEKKYLKRIKFFFKYNDDKNCERLYINLLKNSTLELKESANYNKYIFKINIMLIFLILFKFKNIK